MEFMKILLQKEIKKNQKGWNRILELSTNLGIVMKKFTRNRKQGNEEMYENGKQVNDVGRMDETKTKLNLLPIMVWK